MSNIASLESAIPVPRETTRINDQMTDIDNEMNLDLNTDTTTTNNLTPAYESAPSSGSGSEIDLAIVDNQFDTTGGNSDSNNSIYTRDRDTTSVHEQAIIKSFQANSKSSFSTSNLYNNRFNGTANDLLNRNRNANRISHDYKHDNAQNAIESKINQDSPIHYLPPELLGMIFSYLSKKNDLLNTSLVSSSWFKPAIEYLWLRPHLSHENKQSALNSICTVLKLEQQAQTSINYSSIIKRLNFLSHADILDDASLLAFSKCTYLERISLTNCKNITDDSLVEILKNNPNVISLDITNVSSLTDKVPFILSEYCVKLQTLYASNCTNFTDAGIQILAMNCRYLKRVKLTNCANISDDSISILLKNCPQLIELDLFGCEKITNETVSQVFVRLNQLREINLGLNTFITDQAFMQVTPSTLLLDRLRVVDFTGCAHLTDVSIGKLILAAPRIRNIVLTKCLNITDQSLMEISRLGRFLQYIHLGHCNNITDFGINQLSRSCVKIQYIDVACCTQLTNTSVYDLSLLPKLRRIGLVKCVNITDSAVLALAHTTANDHMLERVHLSYCTNISLHAVMRLLNSCLRLNHLSLTGVNAFMRADLRQYCREPPSDFNQHQQALFCVYSGDGVGKLRDHLNRLAERHREAQLQQPENREVLEFQQFQQYQLQHLQNLQQQHETPDAFTRMQGNTEGQAQNEQGPRLSEGQLNGFGDIFSQRLPDQIEASILSRFNITEESLNQARLSSQRHREEIMRQNANRGEAAQNTINDNSGTNTITTNTDITTNNNSRNNDILQLQAGLFSNNNGLAQRADMEGILETEPTLPPPTPTVQQRQQPAPLLPQQPWHQAGQTQLFQNWQHTTRDASRPVGESRGNYENPLLTPLNFLRNLAGDNIMNRNTSTNAENINNARPNILNSGINEASPQSQQTTISQSLSQPYTLTDNGDREAGFSNGLNINFHTPVSNRSNNNSGIPVTAVTDNATEPDQNQMQELNIAGERMAFIRENIL